MKDLKRIEELIARVKAAAETKALAVRQLRKPDGSAIFAPVEEGRRRAEIEATYRATLEEARVASSETAAEVAQERAALEQRTRVRASDFSQSDMPVAAGYMGMLDSDIGAAPLPAATQAIEGIVNERSNAILRRTALRVAQQRMDALDSERLDPPARAAFVESVNGLTNAVHPTIRAERANLDALDGAAAQLGIASAMSEHMGRYEPQ